MNRLFAALTAALLLLSGVARADHHMADVKEGPSCKYCGMDRAKFAASRMVVEYDDGSKLSACSLHCVAVDLALQIDRTPAAIKVADFGTQALLDAEKAVWVLGGSKPGVMTKRAKWAFAEKAAAEAFVKENGGTLASFEDAVKAAYEDMYQDNKMIREKRKAMRAAKQPAAAPAAPAKQAEKAGHAH
ncbi:MAG TPA: nitrous oxide reductase accessory protein NosL [Anaeromyxobacter sp.]|nr:nitrous oxide reductase accessory protein NosL [Anaeromyxobacter sp.]